MWSCNKFSMRSTCAFFKLWIRKNQFINWLFSVSQFSDTTARGWFEQVNGPLCGNFEHQRNQGSIAKSKSMFQIQMQLKFIIVFQFLNLLLLLQGKLKENWDLSAFETLHKTDLEIELWCKISTDFCYKTWRHVFQLALGFFFIPEFSHCLHNN